MKTSHCPIRAALFDMDGTLVDNTHIHVRAFEIFCDRYQATDWQERLNQAFGMGSDDIMRMLLPEEVIRERGLKALGDEKEAIYREIYAPEIHPITGLRELLTLLREAGIRCAVGSSGCRENVDFVLEKCHIGEFFEERISGDMVTQCKPEPEIYLTAAKKLGVNIKDCIIFEDARAGFEAARRAEAGLVVGLTTTLKKEVILAENLADLIIDDFSQIERLKQLTQAELAPVLGEQSDE